MLPRFCKLCFQALDESVIINLRRYSAKHSNATSEYFTDDEHHNYDENNIDNKDIPLEKPKRQLIIKCKTKPLNFYEGDTYPKYQPIPLASRNWQSNNSKGDYFTIYPFKSGIDEDMVDSTLSFRDMNLHKELVKNLEENNINSPTPIQSLGIPKILEGHNVMLTAETGCGKTYAFLLPMLQQILNWKPQQDRGFNNPLGIIITPSRELTTQISREAKKLAKGLDINIVTLTGGKTKRIFKNPPVGEVDLIVATLGVIQKLVKMNVYKLDAVRHIVLDEADTLLDRTFQDYVKAFLRKIPIDAFRNYNEGYPSTAQLTLNSATVPQDLPETFNEIVESSSILPITTGFEHFMKVPQKFFRLGGSQKPMVLLKLVKPKMKSKTPIIIFSNTSETCDFTKIFLEQFNIRSVNLHGHMPMHIRRTKFNEFQSGTCNVLTTTDAGARGLDTVVAKDVINFDFPLITSEYIHRCGRIGRIGSPKDCRVINFIQKPLEIIMARKIEFATRKLKPIPMVDLIHDSADEEGQFFTTTVEEKDNAETEYKTTLDGDENRYKIPG